MFITLQTSSSNSLYAGPLMLPGLVFKAILKHSKLKFLEDLDIFFPGGPLKLPDVMIDDTNL